MSHTVVEKRVQCIIIIITIIIIIIGGNVYDMVLMFVVGGALQPASGRCGGDHVLVTAGGISFVSPHRGEVGL